MEGRGEEGEIAGWATPSFVLNSIARQAFWCQLDPIAFAINFAMAIELRGERGASQPAVFVKLYSSLEEAISTLNTLNLHRLPGVELFQRPIRIKRGLHPLRTK